MVLMWTRMIWLLRNGSMHPIIGKVAALFIQDFDDPVVLSAVTEIENLTTGFSRKIWQKMVIIRSSQLEDELLIPDANMPGEEKS